MKFLTDIIKVARPGFWPTHLWFFLLPFSGRDMFGSTAFWVGATYVCFPLGLLLYGWNDLSDVDTDKNNPRKDSWLFGARPELSLRRRLPFVIAVVQVPFVLAFVSFAGPKMLLWMLAVVVTNALYNQANFKGRPVLDLLNQVGYLLIFVLASWLCAVPQLNAPAMVFSALFAMLSHLFGQLMDVDEDRAAGRMSTAVRMGAARAKRLLSLLMVVEAALAAFYFQSLPVVVFMVSGAVLFLADSFRAPVRYPTTFLKAFFIGWNLIVLSTMFFVWKHGVFVVRAPPL